MSPMRGHIGQYSRNRDTAASLARRPGSETRPPAAVPGARKIAEQLLPGFFRRLSAMLAAGMPIVASLASLEKQTRNPHFRTTIGRVRKAIENGTSLAEALRPFPSVFDDLSVSMIRGGEAGGQLAEAIGRIASSLEARHRLRRKVKAAMVYPVIVLCVACVIATGLILFVVPVFGQMFAEFKSALPAPTQFLLDASHWVMRYGLGLLALSALAFFGFRRWKATPRGAYSLDRLALSLPVFGDLARKIVSARFSRTFGQLMRSGVPILDALAISSGAMGNGVAAAVVTGCRETVARGDPLSSGLRHQSVFDPLLVDMLEAGEKTGKLDDMMEFTAGYFEEEVDVSLGALTSMLEPILMVFLGGVIGGIVICMFLPIFKMPTILAGG